MRVLVLRSLEVGVLVVGVPVVEVPGTRIRVVVVPALTKLLPGTLGGGISVPGVPVVTVTVPGGGPVSLPAPVPFPVTGKVTFDVDTCLREGIPFHSSMVKDFG